MKLGLRWITDVASVNCWNYASPPVFAEGDSNTLYFQLVNEQAVGNLVGGLNPAFGLGPATPVSSVPRRYMPAVGATLTVTLDSIEAAKVLTRTPSQPYPTSDPSIFRLDIMPSDPVRGTVDMILRLNESGVVHTGMVQGALRVCSTQRI